MNTYANVGHRRHDGYKVPDDIHDYGETEDQKRQEENKERNEFERGHY